MQHLLIILCRACCRCPRRKQTRHLLRLSTRIQESAWLPLLLRCSLLPRALCSAGAPAPWLPWSKRLLGWRGGRSSTGASLLLPPARRHSIQPALVGCSTAAQLQGHACFARLLPPAVGLSSFSLRPHSQLFCCCGNRHLAHLTTLADWLCLGTAQLFHPPGICLANSCPHVHLHCIDACRTNQNHAIDARKHGVRGAGQAAANTVQACHKQCGVPAELPHPSIKGAAATKCQLCQDQLQNQVPQKWVAHGQHAFAAVQLDKDQTELICTTASMTEGPKAKWGHS